MEGSAINDTQIHKHDVFISYSTKNKNVADAIVSDFEQHGIKCWYAPRDIVPGQEWVTAIKEGLSDARIFVLIYTNESNESRQVMNEVALAFNAGKTIVPFRLTEELMNNELEYYLTRVHWLDAITKPLNKNIEELRKYVGNILQHTTETDSMPVQKTEPVKKKKTNPLKIIIPVAVSLVVLIGVLFAVLAGAPARNMAKGIAAYNSEYHGSADDALARECFEKAAKKKPDAYYYLGRLDEREYKYEDALDKYETGMENGSNLATARLGYLYQTGNGVTIDIDKAKELYDEAYANGCKEAAYYLGFFAMNGLDKEDDYAEIALDSFKESLKSSDIETIGLTYLKIGDLYKNGFAGVERDYDKAIENYNHSLKKDHSRRGDVYYSIGLIYLAQGKDDEANEYYAKSLEYYEEAAKQGNIVALGNVALSYEYGRGCGVNGQTAFDYYKKAADLGNYRSMTNIGHLFRYGKDPLQKNTESAYEWYDKAARKGYGYAMACIGDMYYLGEYGQVDGKINYDEASNWYEKAAKNGYAGAYASLGDMYLYGKGVDKDIDIALEKYQKGIDMGNTTAMVKLGYYYDLVVETPNYPEAIKWYMKAVNGGDTTAMTLVGLLYEYGDGVSQDYQEAAKFYRMAAGEGYTNASYHLGEFYYYGYLSDDKKTPDYEKAYKYFKKASESGDTDSLNYLGIMYQCGYYVDINIDTAKDYYQKAVDSGNIVAARNLGNIYYLEDKDFEKAKELYEDKGGWEDDDLVSLRLGLMYFDDSVDGGAIANDYSKAKYYFLKALEFGYSNDPVMAELYSDIGYCSYHTEEYEDFAIYSEKAANIDVNNAKYARNAGVGYDLIYDYDNAVKWYSIALDRGYKDEDLISWIKDLNDKNLISQTAYNNYAKKWLEN
ncbi:MAG: toll/interleukin-1 receptor domain-containing protein [Saccharofermentans sp.]|nr:toll/interleukin-1 receptor domain-containing protein [Saccharofermentans sp.]